MSRIGGKSVGLSRTFGEPRRPKQSLLPPKRRAKTFLASPPIPHEQLLSHSQGSRCLMSARNG